MISELNVSVFTSFYNKTTLLSSGYQDSERDPQEPAGIMTGPVDTPGASRGWEVIPCQTRASRQRILPRTPSVRGTGYVGAHTTPSPGLARARRVG
jgi:hypothetical protein